MGDFANWQEGWVLGEMTYIAESVQRLTQKRKYSLCLLGLTPSLPSTWQSSRPSGLGLLTDSLFLLI